MAIHATTTTVNGVSSATMTAVDGLPNALLYTTYGSNELGAALALCRKLVEQGYDPESQISVPVLGAVGLYVAI